MIIINNLNYSFGSQKIYDSVSFVINEDDRIGLVGLNGSGKSTLLKFIDQARVTPSPSISLAKNKSLAYFPQDVVLQSDKSIFDETLSSFALLSQLLKTVHECEKILETNPNDQSTLEQYAHTQEQLRQLNPHKIKAQTQEMLMGLGFNQHQLNQPVSELSSGWKMRIVLAKLLLKNADFYLFDEPTNHLDIVAKEWFMNFLQNASFGFILVCHERYFLNEVCTKILELEMGKAKMYTGNYGVYEHLKEQSRMALEAAYAQQQKEIQAKQATIDRFRAKASKAKMAQSMIKALDKVERITLPPTSKNVTIQFPPVQQSGKVVMEVRNVAYSFDKKQLFKNVNITLERGDKMALIAPNGVGKTTLFNIISGKYPLQQGTVSLGYQVHYAIFDQDQTAALPADKSILQTIEESSPNLSQQVIRSMLGAFLFSSDDVHKKIKVLSGGEKNRVGMIKILLQNANLLLLDEPTNHLDIPSKEVLLKALQTYKGTILFVSHDRDFINNLATKIVELTPQGTLLYHGNYDSYRYQKDAFENPQEIKKVAPSSAPIKTVILKPSSQEAQKKIRALERLIDTTEKSIKKVELEFVDLSYGTPEFEKAQTKLIKLKKELEELLLEWEMQS